MRWNPQASEAEKKVAAQLRKASSFYRFLWEVRGELKHLDFSPILLLLNPKLILCVGRIAAQTLLGTDSPIGKLRGKLHHLSPQHPNGTPRPMIVTYHPAYLLRSPAEKRKAWNDLVLAMQIYERSGGAIA